MPYGILAADQIQSSVTGVSLGAGNATRFKNRLINSDMRIAQRGTSFALTGTSLAGNYLVDRWYVETANSSANATWSQSTDVPAGQGFQYSLLQTVTSAQASVASSGQYYGLAQCIEGYNFADFNYGTSGARNGYLSFWVKSSVTGTFCGGFCQNSGTTARTYPFTYTISSANTWTYITIPVSGDTTANAINTTNGIGLRVEFYSMLSSGYATGTVNQWNANSGANQFASSTGTNLFATNGSTWQITGVQFEVGSSATGFEYVDYTTQLAMCQRYYQTYSPPPLRGVVAGSTSFGRLGMVLPVVMRTAPTAAIPTALPVFDGSATATTSNITTNFSTATTVELDLVATTGSLNAFRPCVVYQGSGGVLTVSAEL